MIKNICISKLELLESPYPCDTVTRQLNYIHEHTHLPFIESLLKTLLPVKVISCNRKLCAYESLDELNLLRSIHPQLEIQVIIVRRAKDISEVKRAVYDHYYLKHLSPLNNHDLYSLESLGYDESSRPCYINQRQYTDLLDCHRSLLYRRHQKIFNSAHRTTLSPNPNPSDRNFSWDSLTKNIPEQPDG